MKTAISFVLTTISVMSLFFAPQALSAQDVEFLSAPAKTVAGRELFELPEREFGVEAASGHEIRWSIDEGENAAFDPANIQFGLWDDVCEWTGETYDQAAKVVDDLARQAAEKYEAVKAAALEAWNALADEVRAFCDDPEGYTSEQLQAALDGLKKLAASLDDLRAAIAAEFKQLFEDPKGWLVARQEQLGEWFGDQYDAVVAFLLEAAEYVESKRQAYANDPTGALAADAKNAAAGLFAGAAQIASLGFFDFGEALKAGEVAETSGVEFRVAEIAGSFIGGAMVAKATLGLGSTKIALHLKRILFDGGKIADCRKAISGRLLKLRGAKSAAKVIDRSDELALDNEVARKRLRAVIGSKQGFQAHHVVPLELRQHDLVRRAAKGGFDINGKENGISLSDKIHRGSHPKYTEKIKEALDEKLTASGVDSDEVIAQWLRKFTSDCKAELETRVDRLE